MASLPIRPTCSTLTPDDRLALDLTAEAAARVAHTLLRQRHRDEVLLAHALLVVEQLAALRQRLGLLERGREAGTWP